MSRWIFILVAVSLVTACGEPPKKDYGDEEPIVICNDGDCASTDASDSDGLGDLDGEPDSEPDEARDGTSDGPTSCVGPGCVPDDCTPDTCADLDAICGELPDGCGGTVTCGTCSGSDVCTADGRCVSDGPDCSETNGCPSDLPYCLEGTCKECVGVGDCASDEYCADGFCVTSPDCTVDPSVCPTDYECNAGVCEPPTGQACDTNDPTTCPNGTFCDPATATCVAAGGEEGCGLCNPDCTCPNGLTCDGFLCNGCTALGSGECPEGQMCLAPLAAVCFPGVF